MEPNLPEPNLPELQGIRELLEKTPWAEVIPLQKSGEWQLIIKHAPNDHGYFYCKTELEALNAFKAGFDYREEEAALKAELEDAEEEEEAERKEVERLQESVRQRNVLESKRRREQQQESQKAEREKYVEITALRDLLYDHKFELDALRAARRYLVNYDRLES